MPKELKKDTHFNLTRVNLKNSVMVLNIETTDQKSAIQAVIQDMISEKPMDRRSAAMLALGKQKLHSGQAFSLSLQENRWLSLHQLLC